MSRIINQLFNLRCASDLLASGFFPNLKEFEESYVCWLVAKKYINTKDSNVNILIVGDGIYPRTGLLFALLSKCYIISIDPKMRFDESQEILKKLNIERLEIGKNKLNSTPSCFSKVNLVLPHSHVPLEELKEFCNKNQVEYIINMPCCLNNIYPEKGEFFKFNIKTPKNIVYAGKLEDIL